MSRLPLRLRLTVAFALVMALVLSAMGAFLYVRLGTSLEEQLDESLELRARAYSTLVRAGGATDADLGGDDEHVAQVLPAGRLPARSLVSESEAARAVTGAFFLRRDSLAAFGGEPARLHVSSVAQAGKRLVLVVGAPLEDRDEALDGLLAQLLVAGPLALILSTGAGYLLAGAALRPVEAMRRRAAEVSSDREGQRLPLPRARDEIRRLGETLNAMLARLEAGIARERSFVADASHELRTPLALLKTELELALRRPRPPEELHEALRSAADEVDRLTRLAEDLLVLARADEGGLPLRRSAVSVQDVVESVARRFAGRAAADGRELDIVSSSNGSVVVDRLRLEQALGNLVDNALRHGAGEIRIEIERSPDVVELRVSDEGSGFPQTFLPRAFDRFARADEARGGGSTGLGLAIVDAVARAHGGEAGARNQPGGGAVVWLTLPAA